MEESVLKEIIKDFYKKELLDEDIEESKKQELYGKKMDKIRLEIDSMVLSIEKELRDNGENLGTDELKEIRHNLVLALDRMNKRGLTILDGSGKIDSEAVKKIIKEEKSKVEVKANHRENIEEPIDIAEIKTKENDETALFEKLKELNLSEEDFEYYSGAIERERERERKRQQDIETMGEEKANEKALEEFSRDTGAQVDAIAVAAVNSGNIDNINMVNEIRGMQKEMEYYLMKGENHLTEAEKRRYDAIRDEYKRRIIECGVSLTENGLINEQYKKGFFERVHIYKDKTNVSILEREFTDSVESIEISGDLFQQQLEQAKAKGVYTFFSQKEKKYDEIRSIDEITSLLLEGVSREEIVNALKIFARIVTESSNINDLEKRIDDEIGKKENIGEPLSKDEILILGTLKKMDYEGKSLDEILQSEELDELIDKVEETVERIETERVYGEGEIAIFPKEELTPVDEAILEPAKRFTTPLHEMRHATLEKRTDGEDAVSKEMARITDNKVSDKDFNPVFEAKSEPFYFFGLESNPYTDFSTVGNFLGRNGQPEMRDDDTGIIEEVASVTPASPPTSTTPQPPTPTSIVEEITVDDSVVAQEEPNEPSKKVILSESTMKALVESQAEVRKIFEANGIIHGQVPEKPTVEKPNTQGTPVADNDEKSVGEPEEH